MRGATRVTLSRSVNSLFQSTRPMRGATFCRRVIHVCKQFQSTRPMRGATVRRSGGSRGTRRFNPRAPCGARPISASASMPPQVFQSTRPMRGATFFKRINFFRLLFQSTRPMRGATDISKNPRRMKEFQSTRPMRGATSRSAVSLACVLVSIHAPHAGRDCHRRFGKTVGTVFQSTRPMRGATTEVGD